MSLTRAAAIVASLRRKRVMTPAILFTYLNPILRLGAEGFARLCARNGIDAALIVDLPVEECEKYSTALTRHGCELVLLASPTTTDARLREIGRASGSIIYYVSREGVTGVRSGLAPGLVRRLKHVRAMTGKPLIVGFGVATADQARALANYAEGVVVGSALVSALEAAGVTSGPAVVAKLARSLVSALERS
jgi:tryptophan synthase alpha chain